LAAFGNDAVMRLHRCGIAGALVTRWHNQPSSPSLCNSREFASLLPAGAANCTPHALSATPPLPTRIVE
jgi:hypothetical protein